MKLFHNQSGVTAVIFALVLLPLLGCLGLAVDSARAYAVKRELQYALDSAALAGAKNIANPNRDTIIRAVFAANWQNGYNRATTPDVTITVNSTQNSIEVSAQSVMPTVFMHMFGTNTVAVGSVAGAQGGSTSLEVALALDNTSSMTTMVGSQTRLQAMKAAAKDFVDMIYTDAHGVIQDNLANTYISVVPFTSMVNIGPKNSHMLVANSTDGIQWDFSDYGKPKYHNSWRGCVFERSFYNDETYAGYDMTDDPPSPSDSRTYFWPYHVLPSSAEIVTQCNARPNITVPVPVCYGPAPVVPCPPWVPPPTPVHPTCVVDGVAMPCPGWTPPAPATPPTVCYGSAPVIPCTTPPPTQPTPVWTDPTPNDPGTGYIFGMPHCPQSPDPTKPATQEYGLWAAVSSLYPSETWESPYGYLSPNSGTGSVMKPYAVYTDVRGLKYYYPVLKSTSQAYGIMKAQAWNNNIPGLKNLSRNALENPDTKNGICCFGVSKTSTANSVNRLGISWTMTGRLIKPWPMSATSPDDAIFGGWANSGCGLPLLPEVNSHDKAIAAINKMDVTTAQTEPVYNSSPQSVPQYEGTVINQGLVWGWRTISDKWRGLWKDKNGTGIDSALPLDHTQAGATKAVVVMTDGLNFLPDPAATRTNGNRWFNKTGTVYSTIPTSDPNLHYDGDRWNIYFSGYDSSAYGPIDRFHWYTPVPNGITYCNLRRQALADDLADNGVIDRMAADAMLLKWGCRQYDCMLRDAAGTTCLSVKNYWSDNYEDVTFGPYYDELLRRLVKTCENMRKDNVRPFFILFDVASHPKKDEMLDKLRACTGSSGGVFDATDTDALKAAFRAIAATLMALRLTK